MERIKATHSDAEENGSRKRKFKAATSSLEFLNKWSILLFNFLFYWLTKSRTTVARWKENFQDRRTNFRLEIFIYSGLPFTQSKKVFSCLLRRRNSFLSLMKASKTSDFSCIRYENSSSEQNCNTILRISIDYSVNIWHFIKVVFKLRLLQLSLLVK